MNGPNLKAILAIKVKRLRKARGLLLGDLARTSGLSVSYLAEIESGKKYPKPERLVELAAALGCGYDELASTKLDGNCDALQSFLNAPGIRDFPFERFGVPSGDLLKLLTKSPGEVTALIRALTEIARQYDISVEHFVHAALRSYQELTGNYYEAIEEQAESFAQTLAVSRTGATPFLPALRNWALANGIKEIDERTLSTQPALADRRAVLLESTRRLLISPQLTDSQKTFVLAREAGYQVLSLRARSYTYPADPASSFEQAHNDFQMSYFAAALMLPRKPFVADLRAWFRLPTWQPDALLSLLDKYRVTPETLMYRITQLAPSHFGLNPHFLKCMDEGGNVRLTKQLNLTGVPVPRGIDANESYCRRWVSTRLIAEYRDSVHRQAQNRNVPLISAQHSRFVSDPGGYFCFGLAGPHALKPHVLVSWIVGFRTDDQFFKAIRFAKDRTLAHLTINGTCQRCPLAPEECKDRVAAPVIYLRDVSRLQQRDTILLLDRGPERVSAAR